MAMTRRSMGDYMLSKNYISEEVLTEAKNTQQATKGDLAKSLVGMGINPKDVYESKAQELGVKVLTEDEFLAMVENHKN